MDNTRHVKKVLKWTQGTRKPGRSKGTWRRDIAAEIKRHSYTWNQIEKIAKDRTSLRSLVDALYVQNMKRIKVCVLALTLDFLPDADNKDEVELVEEVDPDEDKYFERAVLLTIWV
ncbi:Hypothetical predicted protein [Mytilus galloprovincialis]|uniref:Uncharacterized protein n=1 Tax=Mytilus galloprovincialis TaxID=29158 RepID=A0A8B6E2C1_MYTGA|nr:Hypothetical predicted protein [Mytilus galloprovincialis]